MLKVGLTGGIGSGKSSVSNILKKKGFNIIDSDIIAREVLSMYPEIICQVKENFGSKFLNENNELKRREFGDFIFAFCEERKKYENIIVPFIIKEIFNRIKALENQGEEICVLDAPTLIENNLHNYMDVNILVWVNYDTQIERVKLRDKLTDKQSVYRINSQMSLDEKRKLVNYIIDNSNTLKHTEKQLDKVLEEICRNFKG